MNDAEALLKAKQMIIDKSRKKVEDLGYSLTLETTGRDDSAPTGIAAIITGEKLQTMTHEQKLELEINIPPMVTVNNNTYGVPNPSFPVTVHYVIR